MIIRNGTLSTLLGPCHFSWAVQIFRSWLVWPVLKSRLLQVIIRLRREPRQLMDNGFFDGSASIRRISSQTSLNSYCSTCFSLIQQTVRWEWIDNWLDLSEVSLVYSKWYQKSIAYDVKKIFFLYDHLLLKCTVAHVLTRFRHHLKLSVNFIFFHALFLRMSYKMHWNSVALKIY